MGGIGGDEQVRGGDERVGGVGHPFLGERVGGGTTFSAREKENMFFRAFLGAFGTLTASKCSKIAQTSILRTF
jgi:hypothetical protein